MVFGLIRNFVRVFISQNWFLTNHKIKTGSVFYIIVSFCELPLRKHREHNRNPGLQNFKLS